MADGIVYGMVGFWGLVLVSAICLETWRSGHDRPDPEELTARWWMQPSVPVVERDARGIEVVSVEELLHSSDRNRGFDK